MKKVLVSTLIAVSGSLVTMPLMAHDPSLHKKSAEKPECAKMDHSKMDHSDPVVMAMMKKCMDAAKKAKQDAEHHGHEQAESKQSEHHNH